MWAEVAAGAVSVRSTEVITAVKCDLRRELVWVGCESGHLFVMHRQVGSMVRYSSWRAHPSRVVGLLPLGSHMLSLAHNRVAMHAAGGMVQFARSTKDNLHIACGQLEAGQGLTRLLLGGIAGNAGVVASFDLATHEEVARWEVGEASPVLALRGPVSRGMTALATSNGQLCVVDPRNKMAVVNKLAAHVGGIHSMDARGDMIATVGFHGVRMGEAVMDNMVKVFDVRVALRPVLTLPAVNPRVVQFQPRRSSSRLMVGCGGGVVTFVDVQDTSSGETYQLGAGGYRGENITALDVSASGDIAVLGCQGGSLHVWSNSPLASMNLASEPVEIVPMYPSYKRRPLAEQDSFASLPQYYSHDPRLLSELEPGMLIDVGLPPHVVDPSLLKDMNQVDFVGYVPNPFHSRGLPPLVATREVAPLRNARLKLHTPTKKGQEALKAERALARAAAGGTVLPMRYHRMEIKVQTGVKFEEFDFSFYNRTCFAGLENGLRNCYVNSLLQVLYFVPMFRKHILSHPPEPDVEFCLTCEMSFLFRMLRSSNATPCQAANLLRTLKQIPEATALGLLEGSNGPGNDNPQTSSLPRLLAFLTRFLLDHLNKENGGQSRAAQCSPGAPDGPSSIDSIFGLRYRQRVQCSDSDLPEKIREASNLQVDLVVPTGEPTSSWPATPDHSIKNVRAGRADMARDNTPLTPPGTTRNNKPNTPAPWDGRPRSAGDIWMSSASLPYPSYPPPPSHPNPPLAHFPYTTPTSSASHSSHPSTNAPSTILLSERAPMSSEDDTPRCSQESTPARTSRTFRPDPLDVGAQPHSYPPSPGHALFPDTTTPGTTPTQSPMARWSQGAKPRGSGESSQPSQLPTFQTFSELLQASLQQNTVTRTWFQETRSYHAVMQSRVPLKMPEVLVVNCSNADPAQLQHWLDGPTNDPLQPSWLPPAIAIESSADDWHVVVEEADSPSELQQEPSRGSRVVYELTSVVCHVLDADDVPDPSGNAPTGHLIAHIKVLPPYVNEQQELETIWTRPHQHTLASFNVPVRQRTPITIQPQPQPPVAPLGAPHHLPVVPVVPTVLAQSAGVLVSVQPKKPAAAAGTSSGAGMKAVQTQAGGAAESNTQAQSNTQVVKGGDSPAVTNIDSVGPSENGVAGRANQSDPTGVAGRANQSDPTGDTQGSQPSREQGAAAENGVASQQTEDATASSSQVPLSPERRRVDAENDVLKADKNASSHTSDPELQSSEGGSWEEPMLSVRRSTESLPTTLSPCLQPQMSPSCSPQAKPPSKALTGCTSAACPREGDEDITPAPQTRDYADALLNSLGVARDAEGGQLGSDKDVQSGHSRRLSFEGSSTDGQQGGTDSSSSQQPNGDRQRTLAGQKVSLQAPQQPPQLGRRPTHRLQQSSQDALPTPSAATPQSQPQPARHSIPQSSTTPIPSSAPLLPAGQSPPSAPTAHTHTPQSSVNTTPQTTTSQAMSQNQSTQSTPQPVSHASSRTTQQGSTGGGAWTPLPSPASAYAMSTAIKAALTTPNSRTQAAYSDWLVFNDFCISPCPFQEVMDHFDGQKLPVLLFYTQVDELQAAEEEPLSPPVPVLTPELFHQLCHAAPLQGPSARITPRPITAFDIHNNPPRPGMLLALDAEFVALSAPQVQVSSDGGEVQVRQSRLGLARVSVLYGEGELEGMPCIDDYIRTLEPVYDYLTRFSGLAAGDLDPSSSPHPLCTLKAAYLKLRYLVDCGCVFVGHGLKKDFRTINIVVPPSQIIDTVELYSFRKHRKLSLRFLASYMLGVTIQEETHDSVEDARTALQLYRLYRQLETEGRVMEVLTGIYQWGKQYGWEPVHRSAHNGVAGAMPSPSTFVPPFSVATPPGPINCAS